jgi:hypothetical protein
MVVAAAVTPTVFHRARLVFVAVVSLAAVARLGLPPSLLTVSLVAQHQAVVCLLPQVQAVVLLPSVLLAVLPMAV